MQTQYRIAVLHQQSWRELRHRFCDQRTATFCLQRLKRWLPDLELILSCSNGDDERGSGRVAG